MLESRELGQIIMLAVLGFVSTVFVGQVATMISGIPGANYLLVIIYAIQTSFALLLYEGRRWRFFAQTTLFTLLIIPTYIGGVPFDLLSKINLVVNSFLCDLLFNSVYGAFKKQNNVVWWTSLATVVFWSLNPLFGVLIKSLLLFPSEFMMRFIGILPFLFPVIIIESITGGYLGYKIYERTKKVISLTTSVEE